jgi:hypothetical protein
MKETSIEDLILSGAIEVSGIDSETGEFLYNFTQKMKEVLPELYNLHINDVYKDIMYFWERGFVDVSDMTSSNPKVKLTEKAFNSEAISKLPKEKMMSLYEIKRILKVV